MVSVSRSSSWSTARSESEISGRESLIQAEAFACFVERDDLAAFTLAIALFDTADRRR